MDGAPRRHTGHMGANCAHCGTGGVPLEVHHVNRDHTDNTTPNLTVLCRRCHALTS
jgi:5-methylcytosine-specific restriction endonuclease McrA